ncbi:AbrB/MazE/SpoVT family DNA-binding domain-containing protein [Terracidiphilus sp.]|jgi:AbrB family looped-hinge helix DNA binding protein|uniref:AbrB/MazE/SpoVT family DNA-binding domain-containing protein n=1 Tax=Terracidiphilus sp. TaxID=1964191 RepID=UPI003C24AD82
MPELATQSKTRISSNGRIVIPASMRELLGVKPGDTVLMDVEDGVLKIESYTTRVARIQEELAHLRRPGVLASDELIAERRAEARREEEEFERDAATVRKMIEEKIA